MTETSAKFSPSTGFRMIFLNWRALRTPLKKTENKKIQA